MKIKVPATSANIGCGFDSLGFAVNLYLEVEVLAEADSWQVKHELGDEIPSDEKNLIVETALKIDPDLSPKILRVKNEVPVSRGLGSSSTALVAGIELAHRLGKRPLTLEEKLNMACELEGHPDNVLPAILGGFVSSFYQQGNLSYVKVDLEKVGLVAVVPDRLLSTLDMRQVLPTDLPYETAVNASAIANTMLAHFLTGNFEAAGKLMEQDLLHEPYRKKLIPELDIVRTISHQHDAYGTYLSGAGSTIMTMIAPDKIPSLVAALSILPDVTVKVLEMVSVGGHDASLHDKMPL